jgi:hypothetical protein
MCTYIMAFFVPMLGAISAMKNEGVDLKTVFGPEVGHALELASDVTNVVRVPLQTMVMTPLLTTLGVPPALAAKITSRITGAAGSWDQIKKKCQAAIQEIAPDLADDINPFIDNLTPQQIQEYAQGAGEFADILAEGVYEKGADTKAKKIAESKAALKAARDNLNAQEYVEGSSPFATPTSSGMSTPRSSVYFPSHSRVVV